MSSMRRSKSDPPPRITVEDTARGDTPTLSPSATSSHVPSRTHSASGRPNPFHATSDTPNRGNGTRKTNAGLDPRRRRGPNLEWKENWAEQTWEQGRVLLIDYVGREHTPQGRKKIVAQEFCDIDSLRRFYRKEDLSSQAALRVIHVQNASWATRFLLRKFNMEADDDLEGNTFRKWATYEKPQQRGGKPVLNGMTFRTQQDPWRGIRRTAFGCDYLKHYEKGSTRKPGTRPMMELNHYDEDDQPRYRFDVYAQRISVYAQVSDGRPGQAVDPDIPNPYNEEAYKEYQRLKKSYGDVDATEHQERYIPKIRTLDNGNAIVIFENSQSGSVKDTLIGARQEVESRWRRLTFYLPPEDTDNDDKLVMICMDFILKDIFKALAYNGSRVVAACETHVSILEDKIYDSPSEESHISELWKNRVQWLKVDRLLSIHVDIVNKMRSHLHELTRGDLVGEQPWLGTVPDEIELLAMQWKRDIIEPTSGLSELMYKLVGIRDARHSLQLGLSMWRLSWVTFIFLPLTFTVGFFGMNVDVFRDDPPIKWWFIVSFPILLLVLILWYGVRHSLSIQRQKSLRRGVYETLYQELATKYSMLWTQKGPRPGIMPLGRWNAIKWRLINRWFSNDKLKPAQNHDLALQELGTWSRVKQSLVRKWLPELRVVPPNGLPMTTQDDIPSASVAYKDISAVRELLSIATPVAIAELNPSASSRLQNRTPIEPTKRLSQTPSEGSANVGVQVEEKEDDNED